MRRTGGTVKLKKFLEEIRLLTRDSSASVITMMFDLQGLHNSFKGNCGNDVRCIERRLKERVEDTRFLPYLQLHEFEALLYSDVDVMNDYLGSIQRFRIPGVSPEEINMDNPPSKRIRDAYPQFSKLIDGVAIAESIGVERMRVSCPHFKVWIESIESLCSQ